MEQKLKNKIEVAAGVVMCGDFIPEGYLLKPYLCGNENQKYIQGLIKPTYESACLVASSGNTMFEVVRNGISNITAVDINELQMLIFKLRLASVLSLNNIEFEKFIIDINSKGFLSRDVYDKYVSKRLPDLDAQEFWDVFLKIFPPQVIAKSYVKGGLERTSVFNCKTMFPWLKNGGNYNTMRRNLMKAKIEMQLCDIIEFLLEHPDKQFDYIDFSNILLYLHQEEIGKDYKIVFDALDKIKRIFDKNLKDGGAFTVDYMFGTNMKELANPSTELDYGQRLLHELYLKVYEYLKKDFPVEAIELAKGGQATPLGASNDMVLVLKK